MESVDPEPEDEVVETPLPAIDDGIPDRIAAIKSNASILEVFCISLNPPWYEYLAIPTH